MSAPRRLRQKRAPNAKLSEALEVLTEHQTPMAMHPQAPALGKPDWEATQADLLRKERAWKWLVAGAQTPNFGARASIGEGVALTRCAPYSVR